MVWLVKDKLFLPLIHLMYPHLCAGCESDLVSDNEYLCFKCIQNLPLTNFAPLADNPVEKRFWGRITVHEAMAAFYFVKDSVTQHMIYELKYKKHQKLGIYLGEWIGRLLLESNRFKNIDFIVPVPLHKRKEKERGFNQSALLAKGISNILKVNSLEQCIIRSKNTESQTRKDRAQRWINVNEKFIVTDVNLLKGKHILIVDDVLTTGATIDACVSQILAVCDAKVSIAVLAITTE